MYAMDLVELVLAWEKRLLGDQFEEDAAETPDVHFLIVVAVGHEALRSSVPAGGDVVGVGSRKVFPLTRTQIC